MVSLSGLLIEATDAMAVPVELDSLNVLAATVVARLESDMSATVMVIFWVLLLLPSLMVTVRL